MTQKKHRISPEDIDLKGLKQRFKEQGDLNYLNRLKPLIGNSSKICTKCAGRCIICAVIFPKTKADKVNTCPCDLYLKKDVVHVVQYLLLNLKI